MANGWSLEICTAMSGEPSTPSAEATCTSASDGRSGTTKSEGLCVPGVRNPANARAAISGPVASLACSRVAPKPPDADGKRQVLERQRREPVGLERLR